MDHHPPHPAENRPQASGEQVAYVDPATLARELFEVAVNMRGDADADMYLSKVVAELFELSPIVRETVSDLYTVELVESLHQHGEPGRDAARMVGVVQRDWMNERG